LRVTIPRPVPDGLAVPGVGIALAFFPHPSRPAEREGWGNLFNQNLAGCHEPI